MTFVLRLTDFYFMFFLLSRYFLNKLFISSKTCAINNNIFIVNFFQAYIKKLSFIMACSSYGCTNRTKNKRLKLDETTKKISFHRYLQYILNIIGI